MSTLINIFPNLISKFILTVAEVLYSNSKWRRLLKMAPNLPSNFGAKIGSKFGAKFAAEIG